MPRMGKRTLNHGSTLATRGIRCAAIVVGAKSSGSKCIGEIELGVCYITDTTREDISRGHKSTLVMCALGSVRLWQKIGAPQILPGTVLAQVAYPVQVIGDADAAHGQLESTERLPRWPCKDVRSVKSCASLDVGLAVGHHDAALRVPATLPHSLTNQIEGKHDPL
eukprot:scaffold56111_cov27-Tisochrysis_lutea.AAC.2